MEFHLCVRGRRHSFTPPMSLRLARNMSFGRWLLVACFSSVKIRNVSGHHLFPNATTHAKKFLCPPRTVLHRAKKTLCNRSQFRTLFLPHRFIKIRPSHQRPVSVEFATICGIPGSPNLSKIEKVAENREFDGKETLIVKRDIEISQKSFGMNMYIYIYIYIYMYIYIYIYNIYGV